MRETPEQLNTSAEVKRTDAQVAPEIVLSEVRGLRKRFNWVMALIIVDVLVRTASCRVEIERQTNPNDPIECPEFNPQNPRTPKKGQIPRGDKWVDPQMV